MAYTVDQKEDFWSYMRDAAKDAYGSRSAAGDKAIFFSLDDADIDAEMDSMSRAVGESIQRESEQAAAADARFTQRIADTMAAGAKDEPTAIRWILEADGVTNDDLVYGSSYLSYTYGTSYEYFLDKSLPKVDWVLIEEIMA